METIKEFCEFHNKYEVQLELESTDQGELIIWKKPSDRLIATYKNGTLEPHRNISFSELQSVYFILDKFESFNHTKKS